MGLTSCLASPFQQDDFRIRAILSVFADNDISLATGYAVATAIGFLHLSAPVERLVIEELDSVAVEEVGLVDERALEYVKVADVQVGNTQGTDLVDGR